MRVRAKKRHGYGGVTRKQGTEFFIDNHKHVKVLVAAGAIEIVPEREPEPKEPQEVDKPKRRKRRRRHGGYDRKDVITR